MTVRLTLPPEAPQWAKEMAREIETGLVAGQMARAPLRLLTCSAHDLPDAARHAFSVIYVADAAAGPVPCFSDGADWRRLTDRAVVTPE